MENYIISARFLQSIIVACSKQKAIKGMLEINVNKFAYFNNLY